jgi:SAM-dependent methyltransferase
MQPELYQTMRDIEDRHWWFRARRRIVSALLTQMQLPAATRLLDLGCGTGGNLSMLCRHGQVTGVESNPVALELANARGVATVLAGRLPDDLPVEPESYNCVTLLDVLEHLQQDDAGLEAIHRLLTADGRLLITVPAFSFLWGPHDTVHHHYRRYRAPDLLASLEKAGFVVDFLSYYNFWLFLPIALVRLVHKALPFIESGSEERLPPAWLNRMLERIFASERHFLSRGRLPFGVSLIAVARKLPGSPAG